MTNVKKIGLIGCLAATFTIAVVIAARSIDANPAFAQALPSCTCAAPTAVNVPPPGTGAHITTHITLCKCGPFDCVVNISGNNQQCMK